MNLIWNQLDVDHFVNLLPNLQGGEVYFISLSARKKYLTLAEREHFGLGRTEMFSRTLVRSKPQFTYALRKLESSLDYRRTKTGLEIPLKCVVVYVNINPSSTIVAYNNFAQNMNKQQGEAMKALMKGKTPNLDGFAKIDRLLMNEIQKARGNKHFLDIDCDSLPKQNVRTFIDELQQDNIVCHTIHTKGGNHVLIQRDTLPKKYSLHKKVHAINLIASGLGGEVIFNSNDMIPMPGTYQAGYKVGFQ